MALCACLVVAGCFNPPAPLSELRIRMVSASPAAVSIHGGQRVTVFYEGELPSNFVFELDGVVVDQVDVSPLAHMLSFSAPTHAEGAVALAIYDADSSELVDKDASLLSYYKLPAVPQLLFVPSDSNFDFALHGELVGSCARLADLQLTNVGDEPLTLYSGNTDDLTFRFQPIACPSLAYLDTCAMRLCYDEPTAGVHFGTAVAATSAGDAAVGVQASTLSPIGNLTTTFGGDGGIVIDRTQPWYDGRGVIRPDGGLATWTHSQVIAVDANGTEHDYSLATTISSVAVDWVRGMRAGAVNAGIYVLIGDAGGGSYSAILHLTDAGVPDSPFTEIDLPRGGFVNYYRGLELVGSRLLALGDFGVVAISLATGQVDTTYGTNGWFGFPSQFRGESALDSQGQLYVVLDDRVLKLKTNGSVDSTFAYTGTPRVITIDSADNVYIGDGTHGERLTTTGSVIALYSGTTTVDDVAVDSSSRVYVVSAGVVRRFTFAGSLESEQGYGTTRSIACPPSGGCYLLGVNVDPSPDPLPTYFENYVLRLAN